MSTQNYIVDIQSYVPYHRTIYRSDLIKQQATKWHSPTHRNQCAKLDWICNKLTKQVAAICCAEPFAFAKGLVDWDERNYQMLIQTAMEQSLIHGHCVVEVYDDEPYWQVFSGTDITDYIYDERLVIKAVVINCSVADRFIRKMLTIDKKKVYWVEYQHQRDWKGESILFPVWDQLIYTRLINHNMCQYDTRIGSGFPIVTVDPNMVTPDQANNLANNLDQVDSKAGFIQPVGSKLEFGGSDKTVNFEQHVNLELQQIAGGSGFPLKFINGDAKGAVLAAGEDGDQARSRIQNIFGQFKSFIRQFIFSLYNKTNLDIKAEIVINETQPTQN